MMDVDMACCRISGRVGKRPHERNFASKSNSGGEGKSCEGEDVVDVIMEGLLVLMRWERWCGNEARRERRRIERGGELFGDSFEEVVVLGDG